MNEDVPVDRTEPNGHVPRDPIRAAQSAGRATRPRRFYAAAGTADAEGGFQVVLDGRGVRTPGKRPLVVPAHRLAAALASEWNAQEGHIDPMTMPLTRLVNAALDRVSQNVEAVAGEIVRYAGSDLICYRADSPASLVKRQCDAWDPVLGWAENEYGSRFILVEGIRFAEQPPAVLDAIAAALPEDCFRLAALNLMTTLSGSALLALAAWRNVLGPREAWQAAHVDEDHQNAIWGIDREAAARRAIGEREFVSALSLIRDMD